MSSSHSQFFVHPNGQRTHVIIDDFTDPWTKPETILIQSGFGRHSAFWYHWVPSLARKYRVIRRDLRGHGLSSTPDRNTYDYSVDTVLGEIIDLLDQLGVQKVHFLGESTAGMIGIAFAGSYPGRCHSLTTCATPSAIPEGAKKEWALGLESWEFACRTLGSRGFCEAMTKMPGGIGQSDPDYHRWWLDQVSLNTSEGIAQYARFLGDLDISPFYPKINTKTLPVLILAPTKSRNTSFEDQKRQQSLIKGSQLEKVDGKGHEIFVDKAEQCQQAFLGFLARCEGQRDCPE